MGRALEESDDPDERVGSAGIVEKRFWTLGTEADPFLLDNRQTLAPITVAYETYGTLNAARDNVILVQHGLTGSSHAAGKYAPENRSVGYWDSLIGPGKVFDTDRFFVVAVNSLGGCRGTTGPSSIDPRTGRPYGLTFPIITIRDMVRLQERFLRECLGIERLRLVTGGSMGGMQALEWAVTFADRTDAVLPIATTPRLSARGIAFNEIARRAICLDPKWRNGEYYDHPEGGPDAGLALARMVGTITYLSDPIMERMFGRTPAAQTSALERDLHARFDVERYLHEEGEALVRRFDANSYLYLTKAVDLHDISRDYPTMEAALARITARIFFISISSDDLFPPHETEAAVAVLRRLGKAVEYHCLDSVYGHDGFLVEQARLRPLIRAFLRSPD
ncbi:MAG: homoserine O-acetyltransferase [Capsulimonadales bacterium]|nr:homoserine O-acetyltransferase [Capsulimonadales bacterium]